MRETEGREQPLMHREERRPDQRGRAREEARIPFACKTTTAAASRQPHSLTHTQSERKTGHQGWQQQQRLRNHRNSLHVTLRLQIKLRRRRWRQREERRHGGLAAAAAPAANAREKRDLLLLIPFSPAPLAFSSSLANSVRSSLATCLNGRQATAAPSLLSLCL